jgi:hypothetical protein
MLRRIVNSVVTSTLRVVQNRAVGHITVVELHLVGYLCTYVENYAQNHEPKTV